MDRTLTPFSDHPLEMLFTWYTTWFTRVTTAVSRYQEHVADALAARTVGAVPLAEALRKLPAGHVAFADYLVNVLVPVIQAGYLPPVMEGFARFMRAAPVIERMQRTVAEAEAEESLDPNATHPGLKDRLAALRDYPGTRLGDARPAIDLLTNLPEWERSTLASSGAPLLDQQPLEWDRLMERVLIPSWRGMVIACAPLLKGLTIACFPQTRRELVVFGSPLRDSDEDPSPEQLASRAKHLLGAAIALALLNDGWTSEAVLGDDPVFRRLDKELKVFSALDQMDARKLSVDQWRSQCEELGIANVPLSTAIVATTATYEHCT